jgi:ketosteroid isomerase-like protein
MTIADRRVSRRAVVKLASGLGAGLLAAHLGPPPVAAQGAKGPTPARQGIERANKQFAEAFARGDAAGCAAAYVATARLLPPGKPMLTGPKAIQEFWQSAIEAGMKSISLSTVALEELGATAIEVGQYALDIRPAGKPASKDEGKYVVVWKRQRDGAWKLAVDIFNTSLA